MMMMRRCSEVIGLCCLATTTMLPSLATCFLVSTTKTTTKRPLYSRRRNSNKHNNVWCGSSIIALGLHSTDGDDNDRGEHGGAWKKDVVTKEMFLRDILESRTTEIDDDGGEESAVVDEDGADVVATVRKRSNKGKKQQQRSPFKEYKVLDNRDILPFRVTLDTPDPYTHPDVKQKNAARTRKHGNSVEEHLLIKSTLYRDNSNSRKKKGDDASSSEEFGTLLGEYQLGKDTTTGDILLIGNSEYKVIRHRCQYKYAGSQRFVMVRKILEVKEVGRLLSESVLKRQWNDNQDTSASSATTTTSLSTDHTFGEDL